MPQYMLSVHHDGVNAMPRDVDAADVFAAVEAFNAKLSESGAYVFACALMPFDGAVVVDDNGQPEPIITSGPRLESGEQLGGFWIVRAPDDESALAVASEASSACRQAIEVRELQDDE